MLKLAGELLEGQFADHTARLDAHTYQLMDEGRTGKNQMLVPVRAFATQVITAGRLVAMVMVVPRAMTLSHLVVDVTAAAAGKIVRLGIYGVGANLYPGSLILDAGTVAVDTTGLKILQISGGQALEKGIYFLTVISDGAPTLRSYQAAWSPLGPSISALSALTTSVYKETENSAALADPFPTPDTEWTVGYGALRISSLD